MKKLDQMRLNIGEMYVQHVAKMIVYSVSCKYRRDLLSADVLAINHGERLKARAQVDALETEGQLLEAVRNYNFEKWKEADARERRDFHGTDNGKAQNRKGATHRKRRG